MTDDATQQILRYISGNDLRPGDRLPSVRALATLLTVAPPTVREALQRLEVTGTVRLLHGSGVYVADGAGRPVLANPHAATARSILDLLDTRALIEPQLAGLATENGTLAQVRELRAMLDEAATILDGPDEGLIRTNMGFHRGIARMSGNPVASSVIESLIELHTEDQRQILHLFDHRTDLKQHLEILDRVRSGDPDGAKERMRSHLSDVRAAVTDSLQQKGRRKIRSQAERPGR